MLPHPMLNSGILVRLIIATILCGLIGIEREVRNKPAGIRTNALIGLGAALMSVMGLEVARLFPGIVDPSRIASIVVQGVGFIGAGTIMYARGSVHGLTTAATMWVVAGIGIACGFGFYGPAMISAVIVLVLLAVFGRLDAALLKEEKDNHV